ncbi:aldehyde dehydrogenase family protein [Sphingomonas histidinilytica]|uniref:Acyl-CoA reductase n=1 Tax=Rhizorhabdus histidinilytica TaxID=439228 RepID=A0A1T5G260_9SPHN|nr:aldehyde dehydrogenase family protein [Rhizorhabdus histidinilytica]MBO9378391.1 aldehyde dehydrogenase family protein [Rhizorhabdus histidinilytica]SKC02419.1 Acyl-CoA reductase [Rhizorhabdus histidinilytica]
MKRQYFLLVDGQAHPGATSFDVINPALGKPFARCPKADRAILDQAVAAAKRAFPGWAATPADERARLLTSIADALAEKVDEFAAVLTAEQGKPLDQAAGEVKGAVNVLRTFAGMRLEPKVLRDDARQRIVEHRVPLGVVAGITPWNFPLVLLINKLGPALMAGNTMVAKPAPTTPLTTLMFGELCRDVLPAGVLNIICDENELGGALSSHPDIAKVSFTGSTATGKKVLASTAETLKRVTLELGGNDAAIVLDDVDTKTVARKVFDGAMRNAGQVCIATKRAYVPEAIYDDFCDELGRLARETVVDDGTRQGAQIGPVQNRQQYEKLTALIADAAQSGTIVAGGEPMDGPGYFIRPTIVRDIAEDTPLVREEQFGPVLPVLKYNDIDELLERVNDTEYGLGGTIWASDVERASELALRVRTGTVWVNRPQGVDPRVPFRGAKQSGIGTEMGEAGFEEYTQGQIVSVSLGELA